MAEPPAQALQQALKAGVGHDMRDTEDLRARAAVWRLTPLTSRYLTVGRQRPTCPRCLRRHCDESAAPRVPAARVESLSWHPRPDRAGWLWPWRCLPAGTR